MNLKSRFLFYCGLLGLLGFMLPGIAGADAIETVDGTTYDITTFTGSFTDNTATLEATPWFGNADLASSLAGLVGFSLGGQTLGGAFVGPTFTVGTFPGGVLEDGYNYFLNTRGGPNGVSEFGSNASLPADYAAATVVSTPEPGTLSMALCGLLGLCLLIGFKRRQVPSCCPRQARSQRQGQHESEFLGSSSPDHPAFHL